MFQYTQPEHPEHIRSFFDPDKTTQWMHDYVLDGFKDKLNKIESSDFKLKALDIRIDHPDKRYTLRQQKDAVLQKKDLTLPIKGTIELINKKSGNVVDKKNLTLAHIPFITDRNTVMYNGSEYQVSNQQRLKPGVYTRIKATGELEAHINPEAKTGSVAKLIFNPEKTTFHYVLGTIKVSLYGLLKDMGVPDNEMEHLWGKEIFEKNKATYKGDEVSKMYDKIFKY